MIDHSTLYKLFHILYTLYFEDNKMLIKRIAKEADRKPTGTYEEVITFQLGAIVNIIADISKSLAVIADKSESEE